jgi:hypothetical protein
VRNNECRIFPRCTHYISTVLRGPSFLRILLPSSLSVHLAASLQLVTTAEPDRLLVVPPYNLSALYSSKWKHRWKKKIVVKEDQGKIPLMLGFFCFLLRSWSLSYNPPPSPPPFITVPPLSLYHSATFRSWEHRSVRPRLCPTLLYEYFETVSLPPTDRGNVQFCVVPRLCALLKAVFCNLLTPSEANSRLASQDTPPIFYGNRSFINP